MGTIARLVSLSVAFRVGIASMTAFLALYLVDARGISPVIAATAFGYTQLVGVVGAPSGGWLSDRLRRRTPILISLCVIRPSLFLLTLVPYTLPILPLSLFRLAFALP